MAGPERPPCTLPITGRRDFTSMAMPMMVLMTARPFEPASMQRRAFSRMSVWFGESLVMSGFFVTRRQAATTWGGMWGWLVSGGGACLMLGEGVLVWLGWIGEEWKRGVTLRYSSMVEVGMLGLKR